MSYHFTECPIDYPSWTQSERLMVHHFIVKLALKFSRSTPFLDFGDFYHAGYLGYLRAVEKLKWTIESHGTSYVCTRIKWTMLEEWSSWYGRKDLPSGVTKRKALFSQISLDQPLSWKELRHVIQEGRSPARA